MRVLRPVILLVLGALFVGCSPSSNTSSSSEPPEAIDAVDPGVEQDAPPVERVTDRPGNTQGKVFVVEYHRISKEEARWDRSIQRFKADLQRYYDMGFRPVTLSEYLKDEMPLPPGASPIVFTFDDSTGSQFRILDDGSIDPECAVGIWLEFAKEHPDFPVKASFYVLPPVPWGQAGSLDKKISMLKEWGSELGSHTVNHLNLKKLSDQEVKKELAEAIDFLDLKGFSNVSIALPFGISPKNADLLKSFEYGGKLYTMTGALLVGANPAEAPKSEKLDAYRIPRIQAIEGDYGITYWLDKVEAGEVKLYVQP